MAQVHVASLPPNVVIASTLNTNAKSGVKGFLSRMRDLLLEASDLTKETVRMRGREVRRDTPTFIFLLDDTMRTLRDQATCILNFNKIVNEFTMSGLRINR